MDIKKKNKSKKGCLVIVIVVGIVFFILITLGNVAKKKLADEFIASEYLENVARETTKTAALKQIDKYTIIEGVSFDSKNNIMTYTFQLLTNDYSMSEIQKNVLNNLKEKQIKSARNNLGNDKAYKLLNVIIRTVCKDSDGNVIYSYDVTPEQYIVK